MSDEVKGKWIEILNRLTTINSPLMWRFALCWFICNWDFVWILFGGVDRVNIVKCYFGYDKFLFGSFNNWGWLANMPTVQQFLNFFYYRALLPFALFTAEILLLERLVHFFYKRILLSNKVLNHYKDPDSLYKLALFYVDKLRGCANDLSRYTKDDAFDFILHTMHMEDCIKGGFKFPPYIFDMMSKIQGDIDKLQNGRGVLTNSIAAALKDRLEIVLKYKPKK